jgi:glycosyltransferase involved in cell wall biosynthesis
LVRDGVDGLLADIGDAAALSGLLERTLQDPVAAATRAGSARRRVETELSFDTRMRHVERVYRELMQRP